VKDTIILDLGADIRRGVEQKPLTAFRIDGYLKLGARFSGKTAFSQQPAVPASAIPLRESPASSGSQQLYKHFGLSYS
jgi:hypothetical protein